MRVMVEKEWFVSLWLPSFREWVTLLNILERNNLCFTRNLSHNFIKQSIKRSRLSIFVNVSNVEQRTLVTKMIFSSEHI